MGGGNLNLWPRQWHQNRFKLLSICLQSQCNAIITCFHGPRSHLACITKEKKLFYTRCIFFLSSLCFTLVFGSYFWNRLEQQIKIWGMRQKTKLMRSSNLLSDFRTRLSGGLNISNPRIWKRCKVYYNIKLCFTKITEAFFPQSWQRVTQIVL